MDYYNSDINRRAFVAHLVKFEKAQLEEINKGNIIGLSVDEISLYARPEFSYFIMRLIKDAIIEKMDINKIKIIADPRFTYSQMLLIKKGFDKGLTIDQVKEYAIPELSYAKMHEFMMDKYNI